METSALIKEAKHGSAAAQKCLFVYIQAGETDQLIPWQTDQGFNWRTEVVNAVEGR